ncbi:sugar diacid recognition domain-containing protein [Pseudomonas putida]|uniref:sugar diacid recognition domain-containing protein n=1 Tax=Pseudomonas putida TaxID=303 RepID=UPI0039BCBAB0
MFELDHDLAQDIVDRAMAILPCNVNVMDSQGLILGSGEPERINTVTRGRSCLGQWPDRRTGYRRAKCLKGVQPGVNLPLMLRWAADGRVGPDRRPAAGAHLWRAGAHDRRNAAGPTQFTG